MKFYYSPGSCSFAAQIILSALEIPVTLVKVDLSTKTTSDHSDFKKLNPKSYVPVLELDDGSILTEGPAILQYLADQYPDKELAPKCGTFARAKLQEWLNFLATELHKNFGPLYKKTAGDKEKENAREILKSRLALIENELKNKKFLLGERFSIADSYLYTILSWCYYVQFELTEFPQLEKYYERLSEMDWIKEARKAEQTI